MKTPFLSIIPPSASTKAIPIFSDKMIVLNLKFQTTKTKCV